MLAVVLALIVAACGDGDSADTTTATPADTTSAPVATSAGTGTSTVPVTAAPTAITCDEPVTVGVITDISGALAIWGAHINRGVPIGFAYATGGTVQTGLEQSYSFDDCEIRVVIKDDQSNPEFSAAAATELIDADGADIIIGTVNPGAMATLQEIAHDEDVILIAAPAAATDLTGATFDPNTFRASRSDYQDAMAICDHFVNSGYKTFVQIAPDNEFGFGGAQAYRDACVYFGGEFVEEDVFAPHDTIDFTSFLTPLADTDADAFLMTWAGGRFSPLLESAIALGVIDEDTVLGSPFVDNIVMPAFFGEAIGATSVISYHYSAPSNAANDYLVEQAAASFETVPDQFDVDGMNAALMVTEALKKTNGAADADSLKAVLEGMSFEGPKGLIEIRPQDHVALQDMYVVTLLNVDDPDSRYFENVGTVRPEPPCLLAGEYLSRCGALPVGNLGG
jgi:branched-chain amino acid transport system substrate-binding protein